MGSRRLAKRDIVVIGGSGGSIGPLMEIARTLPADFPATVFVVVHLSADSESNLNEVLSRVSALPVSQPADGEPIRRGQIYTAPPDQHLTVERGCMRVQKGPRENRHRPAIDPLFRTAARVYGPRVIGIILSGQFDDGSAGLYAVKQRGGVAMVQDPAEAGFSEMPRRANAYATPHHILRTRNIASKLISLVRTDQDETVMPAGKPPQRTSTRRESAAGAQTGQNENNLTTAYADEGEGSPSVFACPECHGALWELKAGNLVQFRCRIGHVYGMDSLAKDLSLGSESALWAAMRALEEKAAMQRRVADNLATDSRSADRLRDQSTADDANALVIRGIIFGPAAKLEPGKEVRKGKNTARKKTPRVRR